MKNRELIEGEVVVEGLYDPVAVGPHVPFVVEVEAVGVGIAGDVEPVAGHLLAMVRAREQPVDELVIGIRGGISDEGRHLFRSRRQAGEREGDAADERRPVGRGVEWQPLGRHARLEEPIDRVAGVARCGRHLGADDLPERPVLLVGGPGRDPAREQVLLGLRKLLVEVGRGHDRVGIGSDDSRDQGAGGGVARDDGPLPALEGRKGRGAVVEPQASLLLPGPVAGEAVLGEERPDVTVEADRFLGGRPHRRPKRRLEETCGEEEREAGGRAGKPGTAEHGITHEQLSWGVVRVADPGTGAGIAEPRGIEDRSAGQRRQGRADRASPPGGLCSRYTFPILPHPEAPGKP